MTTRQQHANLLRGDDTEMDGPSMEEYVAPVQQQVQQSRPSWNQQATNYLDQVPAAQDSRSGIDKYLAARQQRQGAPIQQKQVVAPQQSADEQYMGKLGINSMDDYNKLLGRKAFNPNNPAAKAIYQGLIASQEQPAQDSVPQQLKYNDIMNSINGRQTLPEAKEPVSQLDAMRNIANDRRQGQLPYQGTFDMMRSMGYTAPNKPTDAFIYEPQEAVVEESIMNRFGA